MIPKDSPEPKDLPSGSEILGNHYPKIPRSQKPHLAIVTLKVDVRAMNVDETLDHSVMGNGALKKYGLTRKGQFHVRGVDEADCIRKLKQILERINDKG
mgnify:CR=1 FL=1